GVRPGHVPSTTLWWAYGEQFLGRLAIRHRLTPQLEQLGGHIGYDVRPTARRRGHATAMLAAALPIARSLGITRALVMCDLTNEPSRRIIEKSGGRLIDVTERKRRYWVDT
ncbi:MAG: GNAT family N-acetyltransferase, partial [Nonomuraea sp.]|nr:GNAT family N-acetyltransferase [Nonomuraea sp.]